MKVRIDVTQDDIKNGESAEPCSCPIALAINRRFPLLAGGAYVDVDAVQLGIIGPSVDLPKEARDFIADIDVLLGCDKDDLLPFNFDLDVPDDLASVTS